MVFDDLPPGAAWRHVGARQGFETVFIRRTRRGWRFNGQAAAVESGRPWSVRYEIAVDLGWRTRRARVWTSTSAGGRYDLLVGNGCGRWDVNGDHAPGLDGCVDVDLESSACTNTLPVHRLGSDVHEAPAAYVRVFDRRVERLEQTYARRADDVGGALYDYAAPRFDFQCRLEYDRYGLVVDYPGIASRWPVTFEAGAP